MRALTEGGNMFSSRSCIITRKSYASLHTFRDMPPIFERNALHKTFLTLKFGSGSSIESRDFWKLLIDDCWPCSHAKQWIYCMIVF